MLLELRRKPSLSFQQGKVNFNSKVLQAKSLLADTGAVQEVAKKADHDHACLRMTWNPSTTRPRCWTCSAMGHTRKVLQRMPSTRTSASNKGQYNSQLQQEKKGKGGGKKGKDTKSKNEAAEEKKDGRKGRSEPRPDECG